MKNELIKNLVSVSKSIGACPEFVQGGGGNVSLKTDDQTMIIKSSGYKLFDLEENIGLVSVNYKEIKNYFLNISADTVENEANKFILSCVNNSGENSQLKPSIETGFHVFLRDFVLHTHSVYVNILSSCKEGRSLSEKIFKDYTTKVEWMPYKNPGLGLTFEIKDMVENTSQGNDGIQIAIYILQNHGLIITGGSSEDCYRCHQEINQLIIDHFNLHEPYPQESVIKKVENNKFELRSEFLKDNIQIIKKIGQNIIFPDQIVFCDSSLVLVDEEQCVTYIFTDNQQKAQSIAEIITAYVFVYRSIIDLGLEPNLLDDDDIEYVQNMDSEKYRKNLVT